MVDLEAVGGAATGGLIAKTFESPTGHAGEHQAVCADCGAETVGRFCHNCGNPSHVHRTLLHLGEELLHGVMHFDSRTWRTLPLLVFRPGKLTREWVFGKRARYVSPLAMFLFTVFVMFMALSYLPASPVRTVAEQRAAAEAAVANNIRGVAFAQAALDKAAPEDRAERAADLKEAQAGLAEARKEAQDMAAAGKFVQGDWKANLAAEAKAGKIPINTGDKALDAKILHKLENPDLALYKLQQTFYKFSFLLVPISIPFVALLFLWKRGFTLYDHGVFVLYSLTFMSVLIMAVATAARLGKDPGDLAILSMPFIVPAHMFAQLKGAYRLRAFSAAWRTLFLLIFAMIALVLFILAIFWLGLG